MVHEILDFLKWGLEAAFWGTVISIFLFRWNPWTSLGGFILRWRQGTAQLPPAKTRIFTDGGVFVVTAVDRNGDVVQRTVHAADENAARKVATQAMGVEETDAEVTELHEKVLRG